MKKFVDQIINNPPGGALKFLVRFAVKHLPKYPSNDLEGYFGSLDALYNQAERMKQMLAFISEQAKIIFLIYRTPFSLALGANGGLNICKRGVYSEILPLIIFFSIGISFVTVSQTILRSISK